MSTPEEKQAYANAWAALQKLLRQGKSESGQERNCCFLNLGGSSDPSHERFATVSAATALDMPDDARGLASCDWDHDGRVDFWITNRTGPRVRLMLNRYDTGQNRWTALRLHGDGKTVNRDAIGARAEVYLSGSNRPLLRTVTAGSGFLSQSSVWQHVGLGTATKIEKVIVKWPGAAAETYTGVEPDGFFDLAQGTGKAVKWTPPDRPNPFAKAGPASPPAEDDSDVARLVLVTALPVPESFVPVAAGKSGLLLNLWSSECPNCKAELRDWGPRLKEWKTAGVNVASWCVDAGGPVAEKVARAQGFAGPVLTTAASGGTGPTAELTAVLDSLQKGCFGLQKDMPVPVSFLFDSRRRLVAIYKGPVAAKQVQTDFSLLTASDGDRRTAACPDKSGRWHDPLLAVGVRGPVGILLDDGLKSAAEQLLLTAAAYYEKPVTENPDASQETWRRMEVGAANHLLASWELERSDYAAAERRYLASIGANPTLETRRSLAKLYTAAKNPNLYPALARQLEAIISADPDPVEIGKLGVLKMEMGQPAEAVGLLRRSTILLPDPVNYFQLGQALRATGRAAAAEEAWTRALEGKPELVPALNNLAWLKATHPDAAVRNGAEAVKLAEKAVDITNGKNHVVLATLAAAQAEAGDFEAAGKTGAEALDVARTNGDVTWPDRLVAWMSGFHRKEPVREN